MERLALPPAAPQLLDGRQDPAPDRMAGYVAALKQLVSALGCSERRTIAVLVNEQLGGAPDVGIVDHWRVGEAAWRPFLT
jgi:hypothetical protein